MTWVRACEVAVVDEGEAVAVESDPPVAVFHVVGGDWFATDQLCSHDRSSLAEGYLDGAVVECAWHFSKFCLLTGAALSLPATAPVMTYPTKVEDGWVFVDI